MSKYHDSQWTEFLFHQARAFEAETPTGNDLIDKKLRLSNDVELIYADTTGGSERIYLLDQDDQKALTASKMKPSPNLMDFMQHFPQKRVYLRSFTSVVLDRDANRRFFAEEVLEIMSILVAQRGCEISEEKMLGYCNKWMKKEYNTIGLEDLRAALDEFDVDKSLLTIVPDIINVFAITTDVPMHFGDTLVHVYTPDKTKSICASQALFATFKQVIGTANWALHLHCENVSAGMSKNMLLHEMESIVRHHRHSYMSQKDVHRFIDRFQDSLRMLVDANSPYHVFVWYDFNDLMSVEGFLKMAREFSLESQYPGTNLNKKQCKKGMIPTWKAHILMLLDWSDMFFGEEHAELKELVLHGIQHLVPLTKWDGEEDLMKVLLKLDEGKHQESEAMAEESSTVFHNMHVPGYSVKNVKNDYQIKRSRKWVHRDIIHSKIASGELINTAQVNDFIALAEKDITEHWERDKKAYQDSAELGVQLLRQIVEGKKEKPVYNYAMKSGKERSVDGPCSSYKCEVERSLFRNKLTAIERDLTLTKERMEEEFSRKLEDKEKAFKKKMEWEQMKTKKVVEKMKKQLDELQGRNRQLTEQLKREKSQKVLQPEAPQELQKSQKKGAHKNEPELPPEAPQELQKPPEEVKVQKKSSWGATSSSSARETGELDDKECLICLDEILSERDSQKCNRCNRRYHSKCSSAWLLKNSTCPICKNLMVDPVQYPALSSGAPSTSR